MKKSRERLNFLNW